MATDETPNVFDMMVECDDSRLENMTLKQLSQLHSTFSSNMSIIEKFALEKEKQDAATRSQLNQELCDSCKLIRNPRQRKLAEIRLLHLQILNTKPADMLCTSAIFAHLEGLVSEGLFDSVAPCGPRCSKCRQVTDCVSTKALMTLEIVDILKCQLPQHVNIKCSVQEICSRCLKCVISLLGDSTDHMYVTVNNQQFNEIKTQVEQTIQEMQVLKKIIENNKDEMLSLNTQQTDALMEEISKCKYAMEARLELNRDDFNSQLVSSNHDVPREIDYYTGMSFMKP